MSERTQSILRILSDYSQKCQWIGLWKLSRFPWFKKIYWQDRRFLRKKQQTKAASRSIMFGFKKKLATSRLIRAFAFGSTRRQIYYISFFSKMIYHFFVSRGGGFMACERLKSKTCMLRFIFRNKLESIQERPRNIREKEKAEGTWEVHFGSCKTVTGGHDLFRLRKLRNRFQHRAGTVPKYQRLSEPFLDRVKTVPERFLNRTGTAPEWIQCRSLTVLLQKNIAHVPH